MELSISSFQEIVVSTAEHTLDILNIDVMVSSTGHTKDIQPI